MNFTIEAVSKVLGSEFTLAKSGPLGNFKVDLAALTTNKRNITDDEKITLLYNARQRLQEAGYECNIRLSAPKQGGGWSAWPHIWVNRPVEDNQSVHAELAEMKQLVAKLLENQGVTPAATPEEPATEETSTEDIPF